MLPDSSYLTTYGGAKSNAFSVLSSGYDGDAAQANYAYASAAAMTRNARRCWARFTTAATTASMALVDHDAVWGDQVAPRYDRTATGTFRLIYPERVVNEIGQAYDFLLPNLASWTTVTAYALGARVVPTTANGRSYRATAAGTSAVGQPTWPIPIGNTVTDGTVTWLCEGLPVVPREYVHSVNLRYPEAPNVEGSTAYHAQAEITAANIITVYLFDMAGNLTDAAGTTIFAGAY